MNKLSFEQLEDRRMLAIVWANEHAVGVDDPNFDLFYGANEAVAREIVNRAIMDWNKVVLDQNFDLDSVPNTDFQLKVVAGNLATLINRPNDRGATGITMYSQALNPSWTAGVPVAATVYLDDNAAATGWFFDSTPNDDAEFIAIANSGSAGVGAAFQASFVDISTGNSGYNDFYRTITHEIGHALGLTSATSAAIASRYKPLYDANNFPTGLSLYDGVNLDALFTDGHLYEGPSTAPRQLHTVSPTVTFTEYGHPNELMNPGNTVPPNNGPAPNPTTRQFISDLDVQILADAYGYSVVMPSTINTAHVTLDELTGTLLVQGSTGASDDTILITTEGTNNETTKVVVNSNNYSTTERVPTALVSRIVIAAYGGTNTINVTPSLAPLRSDVQYVVSSNEDSDGAGSLGDYFVDIDPVVPGTQVSLRAAVMDANGSVSPTFIYVPRGVYGLYLAGTAADTRGDLDIAQFRNISIIGTGAGETVIDASPLRSTAFADRVFDVSSSATLNLSSLTVTGGRAPDAVGELHGGGIYVRPGGTLYLDSVAVVQNQAWASTADGGGIYFDNAAGGAISNSVITANSTVNVNSAGGVALAAYAPPPPVAGVTVTNTIIGRNYTGSGPTFQVKDAVASSGRTFTSGGNNRLTAGATGFGVNGDYINQAVDYIVTDIGDRNHASPTPDAVALSVRDAVLLANTTPLNPVTFAPHEIWLPAWVFRRSLVRTAAANQTEMSVLQGDLDIEQSLIVRGTGPGSGSTATTKVAWRAGAPADAVFELLGDYNANTVVDSADYSRWRSSAAAADGDDNGVVNSADYDVWRSHFGNTLTLIGVG